MDWLSKKRKPAGFWKDIENQKKCIIEHIMPTLKMDSFENLYALVLTDFQKHNCGKLAVMYKNIQEMLIRIFPEVDWVIWKFKQVPTGFWNDIKNQRQYMNWLEKKLNITRMEQWYDIQQSHFAENYGSGFLQRNYNSSVYNALSTIFNNYEWHPWLFPVVPNNYWLSVDNQRKYFDWLYKELKFETMDDFYNITLSVFNSNYGNALTAHYPHVYNMLINIYPDINWLPWKFIKAPLGYWDNIENCKIYVDWLYIELKYTSIEDWYKLTLKTLMLHYGDGLIRKYDASTYTIVKALIIRADTEEWMPWKFPQTAKGYWKLVTNQKKYMDWLLKTLGFVNYTDYYKLNYLHFHKNFGATLITMYKCNIHRLIEACFSTYDWDKMKFRQKNVSIGELEWMEYLLISYPNLQYGNDQLRLPHKKRCKVDGFDSITNTIFQFHGCYWHGCSTCFPNRQIVNRKQQTFQECYDITNKLKKECKELGYHYIEMWECRWNKTKSIIGNVKRRWKLRTKVSLAHGSILK